MFRAERTRLSRSARAFPTALDTRHGSDETHLLRAGSPGAARTGIGHFDAAPRQAGLPLQLAHGHVGGATAGTDGPHDRFALGPALAAGDSLTIDGALLVRAAFGRLAGILSCERESSTNFSLCVRVLAEVAADSQISFARISYTCTLSDQ